LNYIIVPNLVEITQTVAEMWRLFDFQDGGRHHLKFLKIFVKVVTIKKVELRH